MYIHGEFKNKNDVVYSVHILKGSKDEEKIIGENGLFFSSDPINIETTADDTFTHIIKRSCTVSLLTEEYLGDYLFSENEKNVIINIYKGSECIFAGYVEPNVYSQGYAEHLEEIQINCIDYLSTLQYAYLSDNSTYDEVKANADIESFYSYINKMGMINNSFDIVGNNTTNVYYDQSKKFTTANIFTECSVSSIIFLGDTEDDLVNNEEILFEILQYLNLHIIQLGFNFYIFDWNTIKNKSSVTWLNIQDNTTTTQSISVNSIVADDYASDDTNISIADVYNQIEVKDDITSIEDVITSPLDSDSLTSKFASKQLYLTEYISEGSGDSANGAINNIINGRATDYEHATTYDWYAQVMENENWKFYLDNGQTEVNSIYEQDSSGNYINQDKVLRYAKQHQLTPLILRMGSVKKKNNAQDNSLVSKIDTKDYLYISVNGNENDTEGSQSPSDSTIQSHMGMIEYQSNNGGVVFSPSDSNTTNYLVFSGKIRLQPITYESSSSISSRNNNYSDCVSNGVSKSEGATAIVPYYDSSVAIHNINNLVKSDNNDEGRYYTRKFYKVENPKVIPTLYYTDTVGSIQPWTEDKAAHGYQYNYTADGDGSDRFSKLPILECELIIGDKRCIETDIDEYGNSTFQWVTVGSEPTIDGVQKTTFSLGVNPKIGDYIIGDEFSLQNTIDYTMNLDAEGTAIPIKESDNISGKVTFRILGTVNLLWNDITRRHPSFWRHTSWTDSSRFILAHTENIIIKEFECKIYSDNGGYNNTADSDIVYVSDEVTTNIKKKDDIEFKINTALTSDEAYELGVKNTVNLSNVVSSITNKQLINLSNTINSNVGKAEQHYCNDYYSEYNQPKIILETDLHNNSKIQYFGRYSIGYMNKVFYPLSINYNLINDSVHIKLKEL